MSDWFCCHVKKLHCKYLFFLRKHLSQKAKLKKSIFHIKVRVSKVVADHNGLLLQSRYICASLDKKHREYKKKSRLRAFGRTRAKNYQQLILEAMILQKSLKLLVCNLVCDIKKRNHEFTKSRIHEFKVLQNVF